MQDRSILETNQGFVGFCWTNATCSQQPVLLQKAYISPAGNALLDPNSQQTLTVRNLEKLISCFGYRGILSNREDFQAFRISV